MHRAHLDTLTAEWYALVVDANTVIEKLGLTPLTIEGGYFVETYRCDETVPASALDGRYAKEKSLSTAIYYLLTRESVSLMHRLKSDEVFHFYAGDPVEMLQLMPDGSHSTVLLGSDIEAGQAPQVIVGRGVWQGCRLRPGGDWALMGTTVAPAFDYEDYETGSREQLANRYPECASLIHILTKD